MARATNAVSSQPTEALRRVPVLAGDALRSQEADPIRFHCRLNRSRVRTRAACHAPTGLPPASVVLVDMRHLEEHFLQRSAGNDPFLKLQEWSDSNELAVIDDADAITQALRHIQEMGRQEDRLALRGAAAQSLLHVKRGPRVEAVGGLIEDENRRIVRERAGKAKLLLH